MPCITLTLKTLKREEKKTEEEKPSANWIPYIAIAGAAIAAIAIMRR